MFGLLQFRDQRGDRRTVVEDHHMIPGTGRFFRQLGFEPCFEKRNQINRKNQEQQDDADELREDDVNHHHRMLPRDISAVTGGRRRAGGPLQSLHETSRLTFEVIHAEHVEQTQHQQYRDQ